MGSTGELKTKPTQHSVHELRRLGIQPEMIICRSDFEMPPELREKIALFCDVDEPAVIPLVTFASIYEVPMYLENIGLGNLLVQALHLPERQPDLAVWEEIVEQVTYSHAPLEIAIVGKYTQLPDAYLSVTESLRHACAANEVSLNLKWVNAEDVEADGLRRISPACAALWCRVASARAESRARSWRRALRAKIGYPISGFASACRLPL